MLFRRLEQEAVSLEEAAPVRSTDLANDVGAFRERLHQLCRCLIGKLRGRCVDHRHDPPQREFGLEFGFALSPGNAVGDKPIDVRCEKCFAA